MTNQKFDFVVVGGGTAGCHLARRLADTPSKPSVVILEAGGDTREIVGQSRLDRWTNAFMFPAANFGYNTAPQKNLNDREMNYARGKGLGGSSALNFQVWTLGSQEDYNRWADLVGDESWSWKYAKDRYQRIEHLHSDGSGGVKQYLDLKKEDHGYEGPVDVSLPDDITWEKGAQVMIDAAVEQGAALNKDLNSGNPIGVGLFPATHGKTHRVTSATANLLDPPANLTILQHASVIRILFQEKRVLGVELSDGRKVFANKDTILCAGTIDTPKIMLLSGIGAANELEALKIPLVHDLPAVGKNVFDHALVVVTAECAPGLHDRPYLDTDQAAMAEARELWKKNFTGPASLQSVTFVGGFLKDESIYDLKSFKGLDQNTQEYIRHPAVPGYEIMIYGTPNMARDIQIARPNVYHAFAASNMCVQSTGGTISLASADPAAPPVIDINYLSDQSGFDREVLAVGLRKVMQMIKAKEFSKYFKRWARAPRDDSDEAINEYINEFAVPVWHASGSVRMGKKGDTNACVDGECRVFGLENLRVGDLSVLPVLTNNHTQPTAYLVGQTLAEKLIEEYHL